MTLHQLRCFITLCRTLHYTEAAKQMYLSQPSLSYAISTLEEELGVKLFNKTGRTTSMTEYAGELLPYAMAAVNSVDAGLQKINQMKNPNMFRMGYIHSISHDFLPKFVNLMPTISSKDCVTFSFYQGHSQDIIRQVQDGQLDLAFTPYVEAEGVSALPIFTQEIFLIVPGNHPLAQKSEVQLSDLKDERFGLLVKETNLRSVVEQAFLERGFTANVTFDAGDCNSAASFAASDSGITMLPKVAVLDSYNLVARRIADTPIVRTIYLIWKSSRHTDALIRKIKPHLALFSNMV